MRAAVLRRTAGRLGAMAFLAGCYTTTNVATLAPLRTAYPVSASSQYLDERGTIVTESEYEVVQPFSFHRIVEAPPHTARLTPLAFEADLDRIVAAGQGDAVTGVKVQATGYNIGSHGAAAGWKLLGWSAGLTGLALVAFGAGVGDEFGARTVQLGAVFAGIGALSYLIGVTQREPASWQLDVSGNVVRRVSPANRAALAPGPAR